MDDGGGGSGRGDAGGDAVPQKVGVTCVLFSAGNEAVPGSPWCRRRDAARDGLAMIKIITPTLGLFLLLTAGCSATTAGDPTATSNDELNESTTCEIVQVDVQDVSAGDTGGNIPVPGRSNFLLVKADCHRTDFDGVSNLYAPLSVQRQLQAARRSGAHVRITATSFYVGDITALDGRAVGKIQPNARPELVFQSGRSITDTSSPLWALVPNGAPLKLRAQDASFMVQLLPTEGRRDARPSQSHTPGHEHVRFTYLRLFAEGAPALDKNPGDPIALSARDSRTFSTGLGLTTFPATFGLGNAWQPTRNWSLVCRSASACTVQ